MSTFLRRRDGILAREVDRELVLLDTDSNHVHQLNETASFVWRQVEEAGSAEEISALLAETYSADPVILADDVKQILSRFVELGLIVEK